mmetsp:Transcript_53657/g.113957  ORF Transcript_53657/g.113957 Transcript_53657/m.113957 type:complete len:89 (+) Transcript_53657:221-487(+)
MIHGEKDHFDIDCSSEPFIIQQAPTISREGTCGYSFRSSHEKVESSNIPQAPTINVGDTRSHPIISSHIARSHQSSSSMNKSVGSTPN